MQDLNISLVQAPLAWEDREANLAAFTELLSAVPRPSDLIILPEMFSTGFTMNAAGNAGEMNGPAMRWMADMAKMRDSVICGSIIIKEAGKYYNRLVWMRPDGSAEFYDKKHLFRMGDEHLHYAPGKQKIITTLKGWKVMPLICYDLRFPVWSKNRFSGGEYSYDLLVYVANWPSARKLAWETLLRARAIENMAYVAGVNRTGIDGRGYEYSGGSLLAAPDGEVLYKGEENKTSLVNFTLKASPLKEIRQKLGVGNDWDAFDIR